VGSIPTPVKRPEFDDHRRADIGYDRDQDKEIDVTVQRRLIAFHNRKVVGKYGFRRVSAHQFPG
jgi:hypothetical protein